jgi:hypothetical protein
MEESGHIELPKQPMLLEVVRQRIRLKHYSCVPAPKAMGWTRPSHEAAPGCPT